MGCVMDHRNLEPGEHFFGLFSTKMAFHLWVFGKQMSGSTPHLTITSGNTAGNAGLAL